LIAIRMLISTYQNRRDGTLPETRKQWEAEMGRVDPAKDPIAHRLNEAVEAIEKTCREATGKIAP
jgi:hypothetical protein